MNERFILPNEQDIHLSNAPIKEVICQLSFPPIVKLGLSVDPAYQDEIRDDYPLYDRMINDMSVNDQMIKQLRFPSDQLNHTISNIDHNEKINIEQNFFAFSTTAYSTWDDFYPKIIKNFGVFSKYYSPAAFLRTGLRYVNLFTSEIIPDLKNRPLHDFFQKEFLGPIGSKTIDNPYLSAFSSTFKIHDVQDILIQYGIGIKPDEKVLPDDKKNKLFYVDIDVSTNNTNEIESLEPILIEAHRLAYAALRWVVKDETISLLS